MKPRKTSRCAAPEFALRQRVNTLLGVWGVVFGRTEPSFTVSGEHEYWIELNDGRQFYNMSPDVLEAA